MAWILSANISLLGAFSAKEVADAKVVTNDRSPTSWYKVIFNERSSCCDVIVPVTGGEVWFVGDQVRSHVKRT
jgi:hypothetical protein